MNKAVVLVAALSLFAVACQSTGPVVAGTVGTNRLCAETAANWNFSNGDPAAGSRTWIVDTTFVGTSCSNPLGDPQQLRSTAELYRRLVGNNWERCGGNSKSGPSTNDVAVGYLPAAGLCEANCYYSDGWHWWINSAIPEFKHISPESCAPV